jgi:transposase
MKTTIRYSEAFKFQVLRDLDSGRFSSIAEAQRTYGITGKGTVQSWVLRYGMNHLVGKVMRVETPEEANELKKLRRRVKDLERALADASLDRLLDEAYLHIACERAGIKDVAEFKKKHADQV